MKDGRRRKMGDRGFRRENKRGVWRMVKGGRKRGKEKGGRMEELAKRKIITSTCSILS